MHKNFSLESVSLALIAGAAAALAGCASPGVNAAKHEDAAQLQQILDQPNHGNENLDKVALYSVKSDCADCLKIALKLGAKPSTSLLVAAADQGHAKVAQVLISYGAEPTAAQASIAKKILEDAEFGVTGNAAVNQSRGQITQARLQSVKDFFQTLAKERASRPAALEASAPAVAAAEPLRSRAAPLFHEAERPNDYALIIGIEKYNDLPAATYAERDAAAAADFVGAMGVPALNIATLTGERATRSGLEKKLEGWLANNVNAQSTVYFYYSGHGAPDTKSGQAYLVPFDGDPEYLNQTAYPLKRLYEKLGALKAKRVIVMLDSCFSGAGGRSVLAKGARPLVTNVDTGFNSADGNISVLAASGADQISGTNDEKGHGLFSYYLFNGLNGGAKDASGQVTVKSLYDYLKPKVMDDAHRSNRDQIPQFQSGGTAAGDVVLRTK